MARPLRIDRRGGWYHITARGIERREIFVDDRSRVHFLELLEEMASRFRVRIHAYVLMSNHYHLILETPEANLSLAMQWLNVSYAAWFNARARRVGHLFQGRFKSVLVENVRWSYELSLYVHLNPVMRKVYGLGKQGKQIEGQGLREATPQTMSRRLRELRAYRWSSYRAYAGYARVQNWLRTEAIRTKASGNAKRRTGQYRKDVQVRLRQGADEPRAEAIRDAFALGSEAFRAKVRKMMNPGREVVKSTDVRQKIRWEDVVRLVEKMTGEAAESFMGRRGSIGRPLALWAARRYGGMTLKTAGAAAGGMDYTAVAMSVKRLVLRACQDKMLNRLMQKMRIECEK